MDIGYIEPVDKIFLSGHRQTVEMELEEASMMPGMLVKAGSTNNEVKINDGTTLAYGWLSYEDSPLMYRPANIDTAYAINARGAVAHGPGCVLRALLGAGQGSGGTGVVMGDKLVGMAGGALKIWVPVEDTASAGTTQEMVEAIAMEDARANTAGNILVRSLI
jgi:hypothetical protein